jgi:transcription elongation factor/antiterminator RfaH
VIYDSDSAANSAGTGMPPDVESSSDGSRWYAVQCLSHREVAAASHLQNQKYQVFFPRRRKIRRHARKTETVLVPFFPGYLFVSLDLSRDRWRSVNGTYGVASLVMRGDYPARVPVGVVESLQQSCDEMSVVQWQPDLRPGQAVRILAGPLGDVVGELERLDGAGRVRVLLEIMGGRVPAVLPKEIVVSRDSMV